MILEVCASNYQSAINAQNAGAQRIELCENLHVGGLTPSIELAKKVLNDIDIPVYVLIRPRAGDFVYTDKEFHHIKEAISTFKTLGASGIVTGVLLPNRTIDLKRTKELIALTRPLSFTFHRAFDDIAKPLESLAQLIDFGVDRILTSGQEQTAEEGLDLLNQLKDKAIHHLSILPGGGINPNNSVKFKQSGFTEIHASATNGKSVSNAKTIREILKQISTA